MAKKIKTTLKQANWKEKDFFDKSEYMNITTTVFYQKDDVFIDTNSKFLFKIICQNFFRQYPNKKIKLNLKGAFGFYYPEAYQVYFYTKIYKKLTGKKLKNSIFKTKKPEVLFYDVKLYHFTKEYQNMLLEIIYILQIDFEKESKKHHKILFKTKKKKDFYLDSNLLSI